MAHTYQSVITLTDMLERCWRNYCARGDCDLFVEFAVSLNGLTEQLERQHRLGLARACRELENMALSLFGDCSVHPLTATQTAAIDGKLAVVLGELCRPGAPGGPSRRLGDQADDGGWNPPRQTLIVSRPGHPWTAALAEQLAFFGFAPRVVDWESGAAVGNPPLAVLFVPDHEGHAYPPRDVAAIMAMRARFPTSYFYCLSAPARLQDIVLLQRAGADACVPVGHCSNDILSRMLDLVQMDELETYRVLVVEDSPTAATLIGRALTRHGIDSRAINDPRQLLEAAVEFRPDAILMDMYMPFCSGVEATAALRQLPAFQALPVIYLSSETDIAQQVEALRLGGDQFLTKPINPIILASVVKTKIERYREMLHAGRHDSLTGLLNHTAAKTRIGQLARDARPQGRLVAAMLDIDRFKTINDTYGHPVGDQVIRSLAWLLRGRLRNTDLIGRYGGEEFIVALPDTDLARAAALLDRIREDFSALPHSHGSGAICATFSCGVAALDDAENASALIEAADGALLAAKRSGRNRLLRAGAALLA